MFRSLLGHELTKTSKTSLSGSNLGIITGQHRYINRNYDKIVKLPPKDVQYKRNDPNFLHRPQPHDHPYLKLTGDQIYHLSSVKLEKHYPESRSTNVDINSKPFNEIFVGHEDHKFTNSQTIADKNLWFWVERLFPKNQLSEQESDGRLKPSGFSPPNKVKPNLSYFIPRTRSKLLPVYRRYQIEGRNHEEYWKNRWDGLFNSYRKDVLEKLDQIHFKNNEKTLTLTLVQQVQGDIWQFEEDLRGHLELIHRKRILSSINEPNSILTLKGDFVIDSVKWLLNKGF